MISRSYLGMCFCSLFDKITLWCVKMAQGWEGLNHLFCALLLPAGPMVAQSCSLYSIWKCDLGSKTWYCVFTGHKIVLPMHSFAQLRDLHFTPSNAVVHVGGVLSVEITVCSQMPVPVHAEQIAISVHFSIEKNNYRKTAEWLTKHKTANGIVSFPAETSPFPTSQNSLPALELCEMFERSPSDNSLHTTGIICKNVHVLLRKQESGASLEAPSGAALEAGAHVLKCTAVTLEPGPNAITFRTQVCVGRGVFFRGGQSGWHAQEPSEEAGNPVDISVLLTWL